MKRFRCTAAWALGLSWLAVACNEAAEPPDPPAFERPTCFTFVCVNKTILANPRRDPAESLTKLQDCDKSPNALAAAAAAGVTGDFALHALVAQSSRGEISAVDIVARHALDARNDIPGPTFVPAGELPVAIAAAPNFPRSTYVANAASRDITVLRTGSFLRLTPTDPLLQPPVRLRAPGSSGTAEMPFDMIMAPSQKALYVTAPQAGLLLRIPILRCADEASEDCPDAGKIDEDTNNWLRVPLEESWAKLPAGALAQVKTQDERYAFTCSGVPGNPQLRALPDAPVELPAAGADVGTPQPAGLALDVHCAPDKSREECASSQRPRRLLVADKRQPIIHAIDLDLLEQGMATEAVMAPILAGAPTERVGVTPFVPLTRDNSSEGETQYVYGIDARDGSVLVAEGGRLRNVSVNPTSRADRIDLGPTLNNTSGAPVALSLAVLAPNFDVFGPAEQWVRANDPSETSVVDPLLCLDPNHTNRVASRLRGVFVAIGLTDGSVRIVNVHDMELHDADPNGCRNCDPAKETSYPASTAYDPYPVVRNRTRIASTFSPASTNETPLITPRASVQFELAASAIAVKADGTTNDVRVPGLDCLACQQSQAISFPTPDALVPIGDAGTLPDAGVDTTGSCDPNQGRVCSMADPWVDPLSWVAISQNTIPGAVGLGRFAPPGDASNVSGQLEFITDHDSCALGVLGDDDAERCGARGGCGDRLYITSPVLTDRVRGPEATSADASLCKSLVDTRDVGQIAIAFRIKRAYADRLQIEPNLVPLDGRPSDVSWSQVQACFGAPFLTYQVHSGEAFIVTSAGRVGFQHRVIRNANDRDRCQNDPTQPATRTSRAYPGMRFDNELIAFQLRAGPYDGKTLLRISSGNSAPKLFLNGAETGSGPVRGVMPVDLRYSPLDNRLYVLDITSRGLMPAPLDPMPYAVSISESIQ